MDKQPSATRTTFTTARALDSVLLRDGCAIYERRFFIDAIGCLGKGLAHYSLDAHAY